MKTSAEGIELIKYFEKCRLSAYKDGAGIWTIGWGNTYYETGKSVQQGDVITQERADDLFVVILNEFELAVKTLVKINPGTPSFLYTVNQHQFDALVSFAYNCGSDIDEDTKPEGLGDSTLLKKVNTDPLDSSIFAYSLDKDGIAKTGSCEFMKWVSRGTINEKGLRRRRQAECDLYKRAI